MTIIDHSFVHSHHIPVITFISECLKKEYPQIKFGKSYEKQIWLSKFSDKTIFPSPLIYLFFLPFPSQFHDMSTKKPEEILTSPSKTRIRHPQVLSGKRLLFVIANHHLTGKSTIIPPFSVALNSYVTVDQRAIHHKIGNDGNITIFRVDKSSKNEPFSIAIYTIFDTM